MLTTGVFADKKTEDGAISLADAQTGKIKTYPAANLVMDGKTVVTDIPAILFEQDGKTRVLVPLRFVIDSLGAEVTWNNETKEAIIVLKDQVIVLQAGSATALVDGEPRPMPDNVPVKLMGVNYNYRTMVPVRFISEQLGQSVNWVQDTQTVMVSKPVPAVKSVQFNTDLRRPELVFKTTGEVAFTTEFIEAKKAGEPDQLVLDLQNTLFDLENKSDIDPNGTYHLAVSTEDILSVEGFQKDVLPYRTRFVVNMDHEIDCKSEYDPQTKEIRLTFQSRISVVEPVSNPGGKVVVIDAGHGGNDPGATSPFSQTKEKDLNLNIAQKLKLDLEMQGFKVYMTRSDDTYIGLHDRPAIANNLAADIFLSIHFNASTKPEPHGVEMLYVPDGRDSKQFAQILQTEICNATGAYSIGLIERPNLVVIRDTAMPAVLAELGFVTNAEEEQLLLNADYQDKLVQGMLHAIMAYVN